MKDTPILEAVSERDIDLLVLEELHASHNFLTWFIRSVEPSAVEPVRLAGAWHSISHPTQGESDLVIAIPHSAGGHHALLVENKIDAPPQRDQALRYRQRGEAGVTAGEWRSFATCLLAPQRYLRSAADVELYDRQLSYEHLHEWFACQRDEPRSHYKGRIVAAAIEQNRRGYSPRIDEHVTRFCHSYWLCVSREFPELEMQEPGPRPEGSSWIEFRPSTLGRTRRIIHKLEAATVDLQIDGAAERLNKIRAAAAGLLGTDTEVVQTGRSAALRVRVPKLDRFADFAPQSDDARAGMRAAFRLIYISRAIPEA